MNWTNFDRLVRHLETMDPAQFDYGQGFYLDEPACVDCQCRILMGRSEHIGSLGASIRVFLGSTAEEARFLWKPGAQGIDPHFNTYTGPLAIQNALTRLRHVAAQYARPESSTDPAPVVATIPAEGFDEEVR